MLVAVGKIVDSNGLIMGLRLYNTEKKVVKDIRLEEVPNQVKNLNQASRLGAVNANEDDLKPVVILSMDMVKAVIVNINGVEKTVTSVEELKKYKTIQIKSDIELYKEYMARAELAGGSQFEFSIDEDTEKVYIDKVNKVSKSEIENVVIPTFVTRVKGDSFREIKAKRLEVLSDNIIMNNTSYMFSRCEAEYIDLDYFNLRNITEMKKMFISCINLKKFELNNVNSKYITDISGMFKNCSKIKEIDISKLNMNIIRDMNSAFLGCEQLTKVKLSNPNKDEIRNMKSMFEDCEKLTDIQWSSYTLDIDYFIIVNL